MFKFIKWELIDEFRRKKLIYAVIAVVYLLVLITPENTSLKWYLVLPITVILSGSFIFSFMYGAKRTMDSYQNKTFLLESMIPLSPNKILLAKYILAIIFNFLYTIIFVLGLAVVMKKLDINLIKTILEALYSLEFDEWLVLVRVFILLLSSSIATTSLTTLTFLALKSIIPNGKGLAVVSFVVSAIIINFVTTVFLKDFLAAISELALADFIFSLILLGVSVAAYFASLWFVKNKLEIYN